MQKNMEDFNKTIPAEPDDYNGWKNRATWNVALWIGNDQGLYHLALSCRCYREFEEQMKGERTPDGFSYSGRLLDRKALTEMIRELRGIEKPTPKPPRPLSTIAPERTATKTAPVALTVRDGVAASVVYQPGLKFLQNAVDGYIETAFRLPSPLGGSLTIDAYINDEGAINGMEPSVAITSPHRAVFYGPLIIVGGDDATGENRGLEPEEVAMFSIGRSPRTTALLLNIAQPKIKSPNSKPRKI